MEIVEKYKLMKLRKIIISNNNPNLVVNKMLLLRLFTLKKVNTYYLKYGNDQSF